MTRRAFLAAPGLLPAAAAPIALGLDSYSIRAWRWKDIQLLDYAASLRLDTVQISSLNDYASLDPVHLQRVKDHAARLQIAIDAGTGCICPTTRSWNPKQGDPAQFLLTGLRTARAVGARAMRCFIGSPLDRKLVPSVPIEKHVESTLTVLRSARTQALDLGVKIAIENHGDLSARELRSLIEAAGPGFVAACLDTGNPVSICEDPLLTLEVLAPYTVTTHIRDSVIFEHPRGAAVQWTALGDGSLDWKRLVARFRELCPHSAMQLEIITGRAPEIGRASCRERV